MLEIINEFYYLMFCEIICVSFFVKLEIALVIKFAGFRISLLFYFIIIIEHPSELN